MAGSLNNSLIIRKVLRITRVNLTTDQVDWTLTNLQDVNIEFTGETTDKKDAFGTLIAKFDKAKGLTVSGEGVLINTDLLDSQVGDPDEDKEEVMEELTNKVFEVLSVTNSTAKLSHTPSTTPQNVYYVNSAGDVIGTVSVGTSSTEANISGNVVTLPSTFTGSTVGVFYEYTITSAAIVQDFADKYSEVAEYLIEILAYNPKEPNVSYAGTIVLPRGKLDNNVTLDLVTEGTHPFKIEALKAYCATGDVLCYVNIETPCRVSVLTDEELEELLNNVYGEAA